MTDDTDGEAQGIRNVKGPQPGVETEADQLDKCMKSAKRWHGASLPGSGTVLLVQHETLVLCAECNIAGC